MDKKTKSHVSYIINTMDTLTEDIAYLKSELHRLTFVDEMANPPVDPQPHGHANDNTVPPHGPESHYGVATLSLHYTLGRGVPEALGDDVEGLIFHVYGIFVSAGHGSRLETYRTELRGVNMTIDLYFDRDKEVVCLHLALVHTGDSIGWGETVENNEGPQKRSLN